MSPPVVAAPEDPIEAQHTTETESDPPAVTVYWRPGCLFCAALIRGLGRAGLTAEYRDIWQDGDAAAFVRSVTGGDETVPTVRVGPLALVNPSRSAVLDAVAEHAPNLLPDGTEPHRPGPLTRFARRARGR